VIGGHHTIHNLWGKGCTVPCINPNRLNPSNQSTESWVEPRDSTVQNLCTTRDWTQILLPPACISHYTDWTLTRNWTRILLPPACISHYTDWMLTRNWTQILLPPACISHYTDWTLTRNWTQILLPPACISHYTDWMLTRHNTYITVLRYSSLPLIANTNYKLLTAQSLLLTPPAPQTISHTAASTLPPATSQ
jgi:hypothetical protein